MSEAKPKPGVPWARAFRTATAMSAIILLMSQAGSHTAGGDILAIYEGLTVWAIPAMFMLWGMNDLEGSQPGMGFTMSRRVLPALGTLFLWGIVYGLLEAGLAGMPISVKLLLEILSDIVQGSSAPHLWVLYPLIGLYLVYPILQRFTASATRGEAFYMLVLSFLCAALLPLLNTMLPGNIGVLVVDQLHIHLVLGWVGCYLAGWYIMHFPIKNLSEDLIYILGIAGQILTLAGDRVFGGGRALWCQYSAPNVVLTALAICTMFRYVMDDRAGRNPHSLGNCAMGIYFFHQIWAMVFTRYGLTFDFMPAAIAVPLMAAILFLLSVPFAFVLNKIPKLGPIMT